MVLAISGKSGCGNSTVSRLVAEELGLKLINYTFKNVAEERGLAFEEVCRRAEDDTSFDLWLDRRQVELASQGDCVLGSRLAIWLLGDADLSVYLRASPEGRARRIQEREGGRFEDVLTATKERDERDRNRYLRLYDIDIDNFLFAGLIIDTESVNQYRVAECIVDHARSVGS